MNIKNSSIETMSAKLVHAIKQTQTQSQVIEGFDCDQICTGSSKKGILETNEIKNVMLIFGLIVFYFVIKL